MTSKEGSEIQFQSRKQTAATTSPTSSASATSSSRGSSTSSLQQLSGAMSPTKLATQLLTPPAQSDLSASAHRLHGNSDGGASPEQLYHEIHQLRHVAAYGSAKPLLRHLSDSRRSQQQQQKQQEQQGQQQEQQGEEQQQQQGFMLEKETGERRNRNCDESVVVFASSVLGSSGTIASGSSSALSSPDNNANKNDNSNVSLSGSNIGSSHDGSSSNVLVDSITAACNGGANCLFRLHRGGWVADSTLAPLLNSLTPEEQRKVLSGATTTTATTASVSQKSGGDSGADLFDKSSSPAGGTRSNAESFASAIGQASKSVTSSFYAPDRKSNAETIGKSGVFLSVTSSSQAGSQAASESIYNPMKAISRLEGLQIAAGSAHSTVQQRRYAIVKTLGKGSFSRCYLVKDLHAEKELMEQKAQQQLAQLQQQQMLANVTSPAATGHIITSTLPPASTEGTLFPFSLDGNNQQQEQEQQTTTTTKISSPSASSPGIVISGQGNTTTDASDSVLVDSPPDNNAHHQSRRRRSSFTSTKADYYNSDVLGGNQAVEGGGGLATANAVVTPEKQQQQTSSSSSSAAAAQATTTQEPNDSNSPGIRRHQMEQLEQQQQQEKEKEQRERKNSGGNPQQVVLVPYFSPQKQQQQQEETQKNNNNTTTATTTSTPSSLQSSPITPPPPVLLPPPVLYYVDKVMRLDHEDPAEEENRRRLARRDVELISNCAHPNIIMYIESFETAQACHVILEYADGGDLARELDRRKLAQRPLRVGVALRYFIQLCLAIDYLHVMDVLHRDLKPANILLTKTTEGFLKVSDFGFATRKSEERGDQYGTPYYAAPEMWMPVNHGEACDVWSCGVILYEMLTQRLPFPNNSTQAHSVPKKPAHGRSFIFPSLPAAIPKDLQNVVGAMLKFEPKERASIRELFHCQSKHCSVMLRGALLDFMVVVKQAKIGVTKQLKELWTNHCADMLGCTDSERHDIVYGTKNLDFLKSPFVANSSSSYSSSISGSSTMSNSSSNSSNLSNERS